MMVTPELLGTVPQWLSVLGFGGVIIALLKRDVSIRGQKFADEADIRDLLTTEMSAMRKERAADKEGFSAVETHLREMVKTSDQRHEECEASRRAMRREMDGMHDEIAGLKRQVIAQSANRLLEIGGVEQAPLATAAAERVKKIVEGEGSK